MKAIPCRAMLFGLAILICSCDSSDPTGGIEGSGHNPIANPDPNPIPAAAAVIANGIISGLGSIIVQGVEYQVNQADITINGQPGSSSNLAVGQVVTVIAQPGQDSAHADASSVTYSTDIAGPIDSISPDGTSITVLGQPITVNPSWLLQVNETVAVSGFRDAHGVWWAGRVTPATAPPFIVSGIVQNVDSTAMTFQIGTLTVSYSGAILNNFDAATAQNTNVRVTADQFVGGILQATAISTLESALPGKVNDTVLIEGWVTRFLSAQEFAVNNHLVFTSAGTSVWPPALNLSAFASGNHYVQIAGLRRADGGVDARQVNDCYADIAGKPRSGHTATLFRTGRYCSSVAIRVTNLRRPSTRPRVNLSPQAVPR